MTSELLFGYATIVLFGEISGRSTGTRFVADSWPSRKICVTTWSPAAVGARPAMTGLDCSFASASGTTLVSVPVSTIAKPCERKAACSNS